MCQEENPYTKLSDAELVPKADQLLLRLHHVQRHMYRDDILLLDEMKQRLSARIKEGK